MLSRQTWIAIGLALLALAAWRATLPVTAFDNVRYLKDNTKVHTYIACGTGWGMIVQGRYDPDVPGPATAAECAKEGRTKLVEAAVLAVGALGAFGASIWWHRPGARRMSDELPPLPDPKAPKQVVGRPGTRSAAEDTQR